MVILFHSITVLLYFYFIKKNAALESMRDFFQYVNKILTPNFSMLVYLCTSSHTLENEPSEHCIGWGVVYNIGLLLYISG